MVEEKSNAALGHIGGRIRAKRLSLGLKQAELAGSVGISAPYLNLIEHDRRRIAGRLLRDIAQALQVEPSDLTQSAETSVLAGLRQAAIAPYAGAIPAESAEALATRFPGWAELVIKAAEYNDRLEQRVAALSDRVVHDPQLADALHDVLDAVTAIRSTATILAEEREIDPQWRDRFTRNVYEDSTRLSQSAQGVVDYLGRGSSQAQSQAISDLDRVNMVMRNMGYDFESLEQGGPDALQNLLDQSDLDDHPAAHDLFRRKLQQLAEDARILPRDSVQTVLPDTQAILNFQTQQAVPLDLLMRRLAFAPAHSGTMNRGAKFGYVSCDISGGFGPRKDAELLQLPRAGAGCAMLPLYQAFLQPMRPVQMAIRTIAAPTQRIETLSFASFTGGLHPGAPVQLQAHMLYWATSKQTEPDLTQVGVACRLCPAANCPGRRISSPLARTDFSA